MFHYFDLHSQRGSSDGGGGGGGAFLGLLAVAGILIFGVWYFNSGFSIFNKVGTVTPKNEKEEAAALQNGQQITIEMTNLGFIPTVVRARPYDTITFVNHDSAAHWPASNPHPTHTDCPELDPLRPLLATERYAIAFQATKTCGFHDHLQPKFKGTLIIE